MTGVACAQQEPHFIPSNHQNWRDAAQTQTYRYSVTAAQWANAKNDVPPGPPCLPGAHVRAMHMVLLGKPPLQGKVLVWDGNESTSPDGTQFWSIMDPALPLTDIDRYWNFELSGIRSRDPNDPTGGRLSDFGCAGHTVASDGTVVVVGGTSQVSGGVRGTWFAYEFDPLIAPGNQMWVPLSDMLLERWYPTGTMAWDSFQKERILVPGGRTNGVPNYDTYEALNRAVSPAAWTTWHPPSLPANRLFPGPTTIGHDYFLFYPWFHLLSNGDLFRSGMVQQGAVIHHVDGPGVTTPAPWIQKGVTFPAVYRNYGGAVLHPDIDALHTDAPVVLGGQDNNGTVHKTVQICKPTATATGPFPTGYDWTPLPDMPEPRVYHSTVILPDASLVVFGGRDNTGNFVLSPAVFSNGAWTSYLPGYGARDYHSGALLLPDGRVLVGGGDNRCSDYEIWVPPYLANNAPRPVLTSQLPAKLLYNTGYSLTCTGLPVGSTVAKIVLMRPGSTTHHIDFDQRYVQLPIVEVNPAAYPATGYVVDFTTPVAAPGPSNPPNSNAAPPGPYMLFVLSSQGVPSVAAWIELQEN